ncbi:hypothetical protein HER10_EVM0005746 [Colletotrichum scovillei]|uniref:uncharacterized protein n=1 Tax=Colletotrichum scovillei TaxID=1209932 RepID=UPI0015C34951|nr:uncharacterized protein HER10_EVM0005746 [Colletotrichum scovillei]KAF4777682.1 hypothetical protein HER10_EVM0005746 [Colletotrichum scovillei]
MSAMGPDERRESSRPRERERKRKEEKRKRLSKHNLKQQKRPNLDSRVTLKTQIKRRLTIATYQHRPRRWDSRAKRQASRRYLPCTESDITARDLWKVGTFEPPAKNGDTWSDSNQPTYATSPTLQSHPWTFTVYPHTGRIPHGGIISSYLEQTLPKNRPQPTITGDPRNRCTSTAPLFRELPIQIQRERHTSSLPTPSPQQGWYTTLRILQSPSLPYNVAFLTPLVELYSTTQPHSRFFRHTFIIHGIPALFRSLSLHRIHSLALLYLSCSFHSCVADIISDWPKSKQSTVTVQGPTTTAVKNSTCPRSVRTGGNPFRPSHFLTHSRVSPPILQSAIPPTYNSGHFTASKQTRKQASAAPSTVAIPRNQHTIFSWYWTPPFSFYRQELLSATTTIILTLTSISFLCNVKRQTESRAKALFSSPLERNNSYRVKSGDCPG